MTVLRLAMALWGALALISGVIATLFSAQIADFVGSKAANTFLLGSWGWLTALLGLGVLLASRDPLRHILWVRVALLGFLVGGTYDLTNYLAGSVALDVVALDLAAYVVFGLLILVAYPRAPRMVRIRVETARGPLYTDADRGGLFLRQGRTWITYFVPAREPPAPPTAPEPVALASELEATAEEESTGAAERAQETAAALPESEDAQEAPVLKETGPLPPEEADTRGGAT